MLARFSRFPCVLILLLLAFTATPTPSRAAGQPSPLVLGSLDARTVALSGPWQFHLGDDPAWASPSLVDSGWESLSAGHPWGLQGHSSYAGFAWYRRRIEFAPGAIAQSADGRPPVFALLIPHVDDAYEIYWNGQLVAENGKLPPNPIWNELSQPAQIFTVGPAAGGVLAFRVWKAPLLSDDSGLRGGFEAEPLIGTPEAVSTRKALMDYEWLRSRQFYFAINLLYGLVALLSLLAWLRDRVQWPLFWMAGFAISPIIEMIFYGMRLPWSLAVANELWQPVSSFRDISLWFLLLWLLKLRQIPALVRLTTICAWVSLASTTIDGLPYILGWRPGWLVPVQIGDAALTAAYVLTAALPLVLVGYAVVKRAKLDLNRWLVAIYAFLSGMIQVARGVAPQGRRFTHSTLADRIDSPILILNGNSISAATAAGTLLLVAIVYAVYRSSDESRRRQNALEQEFQSARALQQVLIPEALPNLPGFALTSAYRPAQEVGGDFFQIIPLDQEGEALLVLGDVSGKGLKAAMSVSFIVGAVRALANISPSPAALLAELNRRLFERLQGGFATCLVLRIDVEGRGIVASAGHPAPFINQKEMDMPGALPLGVDLSAQYKEIPIELAIRERCTLYTDGLLEARDATGALYGFERLATLIATRPTAAQAADAAVQFGQDDDITVVTLTRLSSRASSTTSSISDPAKPAQIGS